MPPANSRTVHHLYILPPARADMLSSGPTADEARHIQDHANWMQEQVAAGRVFLAGRTRTSGPETLGIVLQTEPDGKRARALMATDPAVTSGTMSAELQPFQVAFALDHQDN